jgi:hypothetical protein
MGDWNERQGDGWKSDAWRGDILMAVVEELIYARLSGDIAIIGVVGDHIYPVILPDDCVLPAITYIEISEVLAHAMGSDCSVATSRFQISCFAKTYTAAKTLSALVKLSLSRYRTTGIQDTLLDGELDIFEPDVEVYHIPIDFIIYHT